MTSSTTTTPSMADGTIGTRGMKVMLFANSDWYLFNFRASLAHALRHAGFDVLLVSPDGPYGPYGKRLREQGFAWIAAPMERRSLNPLSELRLLLWLCSLIRRENVELVHGFTIKCAVYASLAARITRVPARVNAVAGMGYVFTSNEPKARLLRPIVSALLRLALGGKGTRLILQNPDDVALFESARLVNPAHVRLIRGSGVDCSRFTPTAPRTETSGPMRVLLPARLLREKGVNEYVEASRLLRAQGRRIEFLLAGEPDPGNPAAIAESSVREWSDAGLVRWLGHVSDMPALFRSVDVVALPSYREGLPKGLIEAGACGVALVTTDVPGCREVVIDGVDGLLVTARDAKALADAIARLDADPQMRERLGVAARRKALQEFDERSVISRTIAVYHELVPVTAPWSRVLLRTVPAGRASHEG